MLSSKIACIALIIICAIFYILYLWDFALVLLVVVIAFPLILFLSLFITKKMTSVRFSARSQTVSKEEDFQIQLEISNRSIFHVGKADAVIEYYNIFNNNINSIEFLFPIQARNNQKLTFTIKSKFCGIIKIKSAYIHIYDPFRAFKFKIGGNLSESIIVLPNGGEMNGFVSSHDRHNDESNVFSEHRPGDDPSEVFDLRDYKPGDKLNRIHWKLSAKKDDFIVKDYSYPVDSPVSLFIDLNCTEDSEYTLPFYDTMLELLVSASQLLLENETSHKIIYYSASRKKFVTAEVNNIEALGNIVHELLLSLRDDLYALPPQHYFSENPDMECASFSLITSEYNEKLFNFIDDKLSADVKNLFITVKAPEDTKNYRSEDFSSVNAIPVVIGRISSSVREVEL